MTNCGHEWSYRVNFHNVAEIIRAVFRRWLSFDALTHVVPNAITAQSECTLSLRPITQ
jgi:hypothetical protein